MHDKGQIVFPNETRLFHYGQQDLSLDLNSQ